MSALRALPTFLLVSLSTVPQEKWNTKLASTWRMYQASTWGANRCIVMLGCVKHQYLCPLNGLYTRHVYICMMEANSYKRQVIVGCSLVPG